MRYAAILNPVRLWFCFELIREVVKSLPALAGCAGSRIAAPQRWLRFYIRGTLPARNRNWERESGSVLFRCIGKKDTAPRCAVGLTLSRCKEIGGRVLPCML